jgi:hypothetical protein
VRRHRRGGLRGLRGAGRRAGKRVPPAAAVTGSAGGTPAATAQWPERRILREGATLADASQVLDPAAGVLFALVPPTLESPDGPYYLQAVDLRTGRVRHGEPYPVPGLALASGYLWAYGSTGRDDRPILDEADPGTLATIRSVPVPGGSGVAAVAPGPAGSVWAGTDRMLLRVSARTGRVLARVALPAGLELTNLAAGPGGTPLYAAAARLRPGGAVVLAYGTGTGRLLARSDRVPLTWSAGGGGTLWVATAGGVVACVNPVTGAVRAQEIVKSASAGSSSPWPPIRRRGG